MYFGVPTAAVFESSVFSSSLKHLDKPKSQIGFYQFVCLPLFEALSKAVPKLECNVKQLLSNLERWKEEKNKGEEK